MDPHPHRGGARSLYLRPLPRRREPRLKRPAPRSILITGCSSGIGLGAAHTLHARGWRVFATCRSADDAGRLAAEGLESFLLDVADEESVAAGVEHALARTGGTLDALFNNAAFACPGAVEDLPRGALRDVFETNVIGLHDVARRVIPAMRAQGHGRIVNCSSVLGFVANRWKGAYVASKFAVEGLTDTLRLEMRNTGIQVVTLQPGPIATRIRVNSIPHFERWVDWRTSPRADQYRATLLRRLHEGGADRFELPPSAVSAVLVRALEAPRPRARYRVTLPCRAAWGLRRVLPTRALDKVLLRS